MEAKSDLDIAREATLLPIGEIAGKLGIGERFIEPYGHDKAKISLEFLKTLEGRPDGKLILVTAVTPTPAGEGKTTTTVGLGDALNRIGRKAMICLREPSLGPCFGMKGGAAKGDLRRENPDALRKGAANLFRHVENIGFYGVPALVAINRFTHDSDGEIQLLEDLCRDAGVRVAVADHWVRGGEGAVALAEAVCGMIETSASSFQVLYPDKMPLWSKARMIAQTIYRADDIIADKAVRNRIKELQDGGYGHFPICMAKTQYSFSSDPNLKNAPDNFVLPIREVRLAGGAEFVILICGDIMTMPGLPRTPSANSIYIDDAGRIEGLF
jgi:formyltetrahydrofolate synthetase